MEFEVFELKNGLKVIFEPENYSPVVHVALTVSAGTRDENSRQQGIAHFIEHCLFKGTPRRRSFHIISRLDAVGGELNAYTTKEETCIYASFDRQFTERALELISDIVFHSVFPEKEIEKEKSVVVDEIQSYMDSPSELIFDEFEELLFNGHPLGHNILGTERSVNGFTRQDLQRFVGQNYHPSRMSLSISGNLDPKKVQRLTEKYFSEQPALIRRNSLPRKLPVRYRPFHEQRSYDTFQCHAVIGNRAYSSRSTKRTGLLLLSNLLGGAGMNSRLNLALRERNGYAYNVEAAYTPYSDTGVFTIYFGTDTRNMQKCLKLVEKELQLIRTRKLSDTQLAQAKTQLKGHIALSEENRVNRMLNLGKSLLMYGKVHEIEEVYRRIDKITAVQLLEIANEVLDAHKLSHLFYTTNS